jgi:hypothetical protein
MLYRIAETFNVTGSLLGGGTVNINSTAKKKMDDIGAELKDMPQNNFVPVGSSERSVKLKLTQQ